LSEKYAFFFKLLAISFPLMIYHSQRKNVEILKIRFGEAALQVCEVMLKDMTDSKRIDGHVQSQKPVRFLAPQAFGLPAQQRN